MNASPMKMRDGSWGAKVQGSVRVGDRITITTKAGKTWDATVERVVWSGEGVTLVATSSNSRPEPTTLSGEKAKVGRHWSSRGGGPMERLCAGGCGRRVSARYAQCYSCAKEEMDAM